MRDLEEVRGKRCGRRALQEPPHACGLEVAGEQGCDLIEGGARDQRGVVVADREARGLCAGRRREDLDARAADAGLSSGARDAELRSRLAQSPQSLAVAGLPLLAVGEHALYGHAAGEVLRDTVMVAVGMCDDEQVHAAVSPTHEIRQQDIARELVSR